ncbi:MAG: DUF4215 domain-containing protein [Polyangiaceae bacterium]|nr:DUF4215 domain-containing protein [Polyangiaceae bacterium]
MCGNGKLETGESCDENDFGGRSCATELKNAKAEGSLLCTGSCTIDIKACFIPPYCGDGIKQENEECDDGNGDNTDACTSACKATCAGPGYFREEETGHCYFVSLNGGNSWQGAREDCFELGPGFDLAAPSTPEELDFVIKSLGTLQVKTEEIWIGGNDLKKEGEYVWTNGETWDYPINQPPWLGPPQLSELTGLETGFCLSSRPFLCERRSLSENLCRDGNINPNVEECDDGNASNSDACINSCQAAKCGDGFTRVGVEECDDGDSSNSDSCTTECKAAKCGDGFVRSGVEECDDGNEVSTDACVAGCKNAVCGDGFVRAGVEECDDANSVNTDGCVLGCKAAKCGDGFVQAGVEQCDDGNVVNGDGCNASCSGPLGRFLVDPTPDLRGGQNSVSSPDAIRFSWLDTWAVPGDVGGLWRRRGRGGFTAGGRGLRCPGWVRRGRGAGGHRRGLGAGRNRRSLGARGYRRGRSGRKRWRRLGERGAGGRWRRWGLRECRRERSLRKRRRGWSSRRRRRGRHVGERRDRRLGERRGRGGRYVRKFRTGRGGG